MHEGHRLHDIEHTVDFLERLENLCNPMEIIVASFRLDTNSEQNATFVAVFCIKEKNKKHRESWKTFAFQYRLPRFRRCF